MKKKIPVLFLILLLLSGTTIGLEVLDSRNEVFCSSAVPAARGSTHLWSIGSKVYMFSGGYESASDSTSKIAFNDMWLYDTVNRSWTDLTNSVSNLPPNRWRGSVGTDEVEKKLVVFGGLMTGEVAVNELWIFSISSMSWELTPKVTFPDIRFSALSVFSQAAKKFVVFGGYGIRNLTHYFYNDGWTFDLKTYKWTSITAAVRPDFRAGGCMVSLPNGNVLLYGGYPGSNPEVWRVQFSGNWLMYPSTNTTVGTPGIRSKMVCASLQSENQFYMFGGQGNDGMTKTDLWRFDDNYRDWDLMGTLSIGRESASGFLDPNAEANLLVYSGFLNGIATGDMMRICLHDSCPKFSISDCNNWSSTIVEPIPTTTIEPVAPEMNSTLCNFRSDICVSSDWIIGVVVFAAGVSFLLFLLAYGNDVINTGKWTVQGKVGVFVSFGLGLIDFMSDILFAIQLWYFGSVVLLGVVMLSLIMTLLANVIIIAFQRIPTPEEHNFLHRVIIVLSFFNLNTYHVLFSGFGFFAKDDRSVEKKIYAWSLIGVMTEDVLQLFVQIVFSLSKGYTVMTIVSQVFTVLSIMYHLVTVWIVAFKDSKRNESDNAPGAPGPSV